MGKSERVCGRSVRVCGRECESVGFVTLWVRVREICGRKGVRRMEESECDCEREYVALVELGFVRLWEGVSGIVGESKWRL